jgi:hypothetical protein
MSTDSCPNSSNLTAASSCFVSLKEDTEEKDEDEVVDLGPSMGEPAGEFVVDRISFKDA